MSCSSIHLGNLRVLFPLVAGCLILMADVIQAQTVLNVTNFGAKGDAAQVWVNTISNSQAVVFTNTLSAADIGKTILLFGCGHTNYGVTVYGTTNTVCQDLIATITNVSGNTAYISGDTPMLTTNGDWCLYGTNNSYAFQSAINAAASNTIIQIPAGNYLLIPSEQYTNFTYAYYPYGTNDCGFQITKGGLYFAGAGEGQTILTADGAFKNQGYECMRGFIFGCIGPMSQPGPLVFSNITFDAGLQTGPIGHQGVQPADWVDGLGWDGWSAAGCDMGTDPLNIFKGFYNCEFRGFRGEMIKGITGSAQNETILVTNCVFHDGNASAFNYNFAHTITGCTFSNCYMVEEFWVGWPTNRASYFINSFCTNITHSIISLNGGTLTNEPYIISNNVFYCNMNGNAIDTCPASSVTVISNQFIQVTNPQAYTVAFSIGQAGSQTLATNTCNTNIVIAGNTFQNPFYTYFGVGDASSPTGIDRADGVQIYGNTFYSMGGTFLTTTWTKDVHIYSNEMHGSYLTLQSGGYGSPFALVDTNNDYWHRVFVNGNGGVYTNYVSYGGGSRYMLTYPFAANASVVLVDTNGGQIPSGAQMMIWNTNWSGLSVPIYLSSALTGNPVNLPFGQTLVVSWNGSAWVNTAGVVGTPPPPPTGLRVVSAGQ